MCANVFLRIEAYGERSLRLYADLLQGGSATERGSSNSERSAFCSDGIDFWIETRPAQTKIKFAKLFFVN